MLSEIQSKKESFVEFVLRLSQQHSTYLKQQKLPKNILDQLKKKAVLSLEKQRQQEMKDTLSFQTYLDHYLAQN